MCVLWAQRGQIEIERRRRRIESIEWWTLWQCVQHNTRRQEEDKKAVKTMTRPQALAHKGPKGLRALTEHRGELVVATAHFCLLMY